MQKKVLFLILSTILALATSVIGQEVINKKENDAPFVRGGTGANKNTSTGHVGLLNDKAIALPSPQYPPAAKAVNAKGTVKVQVLVNESGDVVSANATSGHPMLRAVSVDAARHAKFRPTLLSGRSIKVSGYIIYDFSSTQSIILDSATSNSDTLFSDEMRTFALSFTLFTLRSDFSKANPYSQAFTEEFPEFRVYAKELAPIDKIGNLPREKRLSVIDNVCSSIEVKLRGIDLWQFKIGKKFGELLDYLNENKVDKSSFQMSKIDKTFITQNLNEIKKMTYSMPSSISQSNQNKFQVFVTFADRQDLNSQISLIWLTQEIKRMISNYDSNNFK